MQILIDTNVILDIGLKREPHFQHSAEIIRKIDQTNLIGYVTASTITDIYYISKKEKGHDVAIEFIGNLIQIVEIIGVDKATIISAIQSKLSDFEDAIQESAARANEIEIIVTRNKKDFVNSTLKILTPDELLKELNNKDI